MVCVPCILLPALMFIYMKFIAPYLYRILPERWVHILDPYLYPTCPVKIPEAEGNETENNGKTEERCCPVAGSSEETKKDK
ncbi:hypothetical protein WR25_08299 [Diploscapter pachys]|uniref:Uncharacterized protein n=1 Tax=Diploscapter pachys TaxID=2018661 RepID=A0A2A2LVH9_9BILA|nr:hypothetical protein WR25_08299 [Diploscapter pachys]